MPEDTSLRERILKARKDEFEKEYEENVAPMKNDINEFFSALKNYCLEKNLLEVRIIYKAKNESLLGVFGRSFHGNEIVLSWDHKKIDEAWQELLEKWYFSANGIYLFPAIRNIASENGFYFQYADDGWGFMKKMVLFTVK